MKKLGINYLIILFTGLLVITAGCDNDSSNSRLDPATAPQASIDRFSAAGGTLFVRDGSNGLPEANEPIDCDKEPFITRGLGPMGEVVKYYNFDVQPETTAPIFVLFKEGSDTPMEGQLNIVDVIPGDDHYNDFWHVHKVTVPDDYVANKITSLDELNAYGYPTERTTIVVNCPIVPEGSTAMLRYNDDEDTGLTRGWYKDQVVFYFNFSEKHINVTLPAEGHPDMPLSDILVSFNINPGQPGGGPLSGFMTEPGTSQTHNVLETLPEDDGYSPFWDVDVYDNADFDMVHDLISAQSALLLGAGVALVNCPVVSVDDESAGLDPDTAPQASIDRFSADAGTLFVRDERNGLPEADEPIDCDMEPFITQGLGPQGEVAKYYNFDVQPETSAPIFVLFKEGSAKPMEGQLNIIDVIPGDDHYSDFWHVHKVTVPDDYTANTITSLDELMAYGYPIERTNLIVNCPVIPAGSTAKLRYNGGDTGLIRGWYKDMVVHYFDFSEKTLTVTLPSSGHPDVPLSEIIVTFNINPDQPGGGPPSGFMTEAGTSQTHNVLETLPEDEDYSPFWDVDVYDNADFDNVMDFVSAQMANILGTGVALVNCPVVFVDEEPAGLDPDTAPKASIDRFSADAGTLFVRDEESELPEADEPIDFDVEPFITQGFGPMGEVVKYYNFDVQPETTAPIFVLFKEGSSAPVEGQLNIVDVIPGDDHYNDFWHVHKVTVPDDYVANTVTNVAEVMAYGYPIERTTRVVNCPVVTEFSTAMLRYGDGDMGLIRGWYKNQVIFYFDFSEKIINVALPETGHPKMPLSDILVSFNINPDQPGGGPPSGFMTEDGTSQTHNVVETLPEDENYSPYWDVDVYDNADFDAVSDFASAQMANILGTGVALVNCPIVSAEE